MLLLSNSIVTWNKILNDNILDLEKFLPYRLSVLEQLTSQAIAERYNRKYDLSRMQWRVMATIAMFGGISARDICLFTHMEKMQVSRAIQSLNQRHLIAQTKNDLDQRSSILNLTPDGEKIYTQIAPQVLDEETRIFSALSASELKTFDRLLEKLSDSLQADD